MATEPVYVGSSFDSRTEYANQTWLASLNPVLENEPSPAAIKAALQTYASTAPNQELRQRIDDALFLLEDSVVAAKSYLATFVPTYSRRELVRPLQAYLSPGEPVRFSKDDAPYIFRLQPCPRLSRRGEEGSSREVPTQVTQVGSAPLVTATQAETGGGYGSAAPVHAEPAPTMTSYSAYQGAGMETWQAPAGYNSSSQPPAQSGYAGDARFSVSQQPAFSLQSNQGYMPQNKYASGHGVYGYASSMYPGSQSFGPVGYGQDAYNAQAQQGHLQSQMMSTSFGGVGYDYSFGRQAQGYPQAAVTYRQDGGLLPTASLQSFNAHPYPAGYPPDGGRYQQPASASGHAGLMHAMQGIVGDAYYNNAFMQGMAGAMGPGTYPGMPDNTSLRNTQGWQPSALPGMQATHREAGKAGYGSHATTTGAPARQSGPGSAGLQAASGLPPPAAIPPARKAVDRRRGLGTGEERKPLRYRVVGADEPSGPNAGVPTGKLAPTGRPAPAPVSTSLPAAQASGTVAPSAQVVGEESSDDEWPLSMFALALHRRDRRDHSRVLDETVELNGKGLVRNKQYMQLPLQNALSIVERNYKGAAARLEDETLPFSQQLLNVKRVPPVEPSKDNYGMDVGLWMTPTEHSEPIHCADDVPVPFVWPDDPGDGGQAGDTNNVTFVDHHRKTIQLYTGASMPRTPFSTPFPRGTVPNKRVMSILLSKRPSPVECPLPEHLTRSTAPAPAWSYVFGSVSQRPEPYKRGKFDAVILKNNEKPERAAGNWFCFKPKEAPMLLMPPPVVPPTPLLDAESARVAALVRGSDAPVACDPADDDDAQAECVPMPPVDSAIITAEKYEEKEAQELQDMKRFAIAMARISQRSARERALRYNAFYDPFCRVGLPPLQDRPEFEANVSAALDLDLYHRVERAIRSDDMDEDDRDRLADMAARAVRARSFVLVNHAKRQLNGITEAYQQLDGEVVNSIPVFPAPTTLSMFRQSGFTRAQDIYRCSQCDRTFRTARGMRVHKFQNHRVTTLKHKLAQAQAGQVKAKQKKRRRRWNAPVPPRRQAVAAAAPDVEDVAAAAGEVLEDGGEPYAEVLEEYGVGHGGTPVATEEEALMMPEDTMMMAPLPPLQRKRRQLDLTRQNSMSTWRCVDLFPRQGDRPSRHAVEVSGMLVYEHLSLDSALAEGAPVNEPPSPPPVVVVEPPPPPKTASASDLAFARFGQEIVGLEVDVYQPNFPYEPFFKRGRVTGYVARRHLHRIRYDDGSTENKGLNTDNTRLIGGGLSSLTLPMPQGQFEDVRVEGPPEPAPDPAPASMPAVVNQPEAKSSLTENMDAVLALTKLLQKKESAAATLTALAQVSSSMPTGLPAENKAADVVTPSPLQPQRAKKQARSLKSRVGNETPVQAAPSQPSPSPAVINPSPVPARWIVPQPDPVTAQDSKADPVTPSVLLVKTSSSSTPIAIPHIVPSTDDDETGDDADDDDDDDDDEMVTEVMRVVSSTVEGDKRQSHARMPPPPAQFPLDDETVSRSGRIPFRCVPCNLGFSNVGSFKAHRRRCTASSNSKSDSPATAPPAIIDELTNTLAVFSCRYCNRIFESDSRVATHEPHCPVWKLCASTSSHEERQCMYCSKPFVGFPRLSKHLRCCARRIEKAYRTADVPFDASILPPAPGSEEEKQAEETSSSDSSDGDEEKNDASVTPSRPRQSKKPKVDEQPDASPPAKKDGGEPAPSPGSIGDQLYIVDCILGRKKDARGKYVYLVRWQGYTDKDNSWVTRDNFVDKQLAKEYDDRVAAKKLSKRKGASQ